MDVLILILCLALTFVLMGILISGFSRVKKDFDELEAEAKELDSCAREILVNQAAGTVKFSYLVEPNPYRAESIQAKPKEEKKIEDGEILIHPSEKLSFQEKYAKLSKNTRKLLDDFSYFMTQKTNCFQIAQINAQIYRYKRSPVAKASIRKEMVFLELNVINPELGRMIREEKLKRIKLNPVQVQLKNIDDLEFAKQTVEITLNYLQNEEVYRLEKRREARREAARVKREKENSK